MDNTERAIGRIEGKLDGLQKIVNEIDGKVGKLTAESNQRKGGWRAILGMGAITGSIGGLIGRYWPMP